MKINDINLDGISFINCNLSDTHIKRISIREINLNQSNLTNIDWSEVLSSDLPPITNQALFFDVSPTEDIMVSSNNSKLTLWDTKTR